MAHFVDGGGGILQATLAEYIQMWFQSGFLMTTNAMRFWLKLQIINRAGPLEGMESSVC